MSMGSTASTVDGIEYIPSMTGEVFHIHHSVVVRHAGDKLGFILFFSGNPRLAMCSSKELERLCDKLVRSCLPMTI